MFPSPLGGSNRVAFLMNGPPTQNRSPVRYIASLGQRSFRHVLHSAIARNLQQIAHLLVVALPYQQWRWDETHLFQADER
jgi:hypothetical protein